jgi:hypothetical protein
MIIWEQWTKGETRWPGAQPCPLDLFVARNEQGVPLGTINRDDGDIWIFHYSFSEDDYCKITAASSLTVLEAKKNWEEGFAGYRGRYKL